MGLKDRELKDREEKVKREIKELLYNPIIVSKDDVVKFEEEEMEKIRPIKKNWYDRLIKQTIAREKKPQIIRSKSKEKIIRDIWRRFEMKEEKEESKKRSIMKE